MIKRLKSASGRSGSVAPVAIAPPTLAGDACEIQFGSNAEIKKVLMQFSVGCNRLVFEPEDAEHVAAQLVLHASIARGTKGRKPS